MNTIEICLFVTICILLGIIAYLYRRIDDSNDLYNKTKLELENLDKRRRMILLELADVQEKYRDLKKSQKNVLYLCDREKCDSCSADLDDGLSCIYTKDVEYALNFEPIEMGYFAEKNTYKEND